MINLLPSNFIDEVAAIGGLIDHKYTTGSFVEHLKIEL
jgi:hypothetical protein